MNIREEIEELLRDEITGIRTDSDLEHKVDELILAKLDSGEMNLAVLMDIKRFYADKNGNRIQSILKVLEQHVKADALREQEGLPPVKQPRRRELPAEDLSEVKKLLDKTEAKRGIGS